jgi:hypothetical protein
VVIDHVKPAPRSFLDPQTNRKDDEEKDPFLKPPPNQ